MTIGSTLARPLESGLPSDKEQATAKQMLDILEQFSASEGVTIPVSTSDGKRDKFTLTPVLTDYLIRLLTILAQGEAATIIPLSSMMTTQQAADILNVSRPYLIRMLEGGEIPYSKVGRHRRIKAKDVFEYKRERDRVREQILCDLARETPDELLDICMDDVMGALRE